MNKTILKREDEKIIAEFDRLKGETK